jgi:prolipoprotein diacylglyceryltransferase
LDNVHHLSWKAPAFLPDWMVAYTFPNNVINEGVRLADCTGQYCSYLPIPVFPTPFYETVICLVLFFTLWALRKSMKVPGTLFAVYLIFNGIERFLVEKIRVNTTYNLFGFHPTQAEIISFFLVICGLLLFFFLRRNYVPKKA